MPRHKLSTTVYLTPEQDEDLKTLNRETDVPMAVFIRRGIDMVIAREKEKLAALAEERP